MNTALMIPPLNQYGHLLHFIPQLYHVPENQKATRGGRPWTKRLWKVSYLL